MSLFGCLQSLYQSDSFRLEDILTEIAAQVLHDERSLTLAWLRQIQATGLDRLDSHRVETQVTFPALNGHKMNSRVDMVIHLQGEGRREVVFVESKVGSQAGSTQLPRYLDHLANLRAGVDRATLVFITRAFEADYVEEFMGSGRCPAGVGFRQARWFEFHRLLRPLAKDNPLARQLALFMQEHRMDLRHRFRSVDIVAMENFLSVVTLMSEVLQGRVEQSMKAKLKDVSKLHDAWSELRKFSRFILYAVSFYAGPHYCLVGFWLPKDDPEGEVKVGVEFPCAPGAAGREDYVAAFRAWAGRGNGWGTRGLDDGQAWCVMHKLRPLPGFLAEPDHVEAVRNYLIGLIDEVAEFQATYPALPWRQPVPSPAPVAGTE